MMIKPLTKSNIYIFIKIDCKVFALAYFVITEVYCFVVTIIINNLQSITGHRFLFFSLERRFWLVEQP